MTVAAPLLADEGAEATLGRQVAARQGVDVDKHSSSELAGYGRHVRESMAADREPQRFTEWNAPAPAPRPSPSPSSRSSSSSGGRSSSSSSSPSGSSRPGPAGSAAAKILGAIVVGLVVLEVGAMLTGQSFHIDLPSSTSAPNPPQPYVKYAPGVGSVVGGS